MTLGEKITNLRKSRGMSQERLAQELGVSRQAVSKWELSESVPDIENIAALSRLFGVTTDYLIIAVQSGEAAAPVMVPAPQKDKTKSVLGWVFTGFASLGIMVLIVLSSLIETSVPIKGRTDDGGYWYSSEVGYSFFPFIKERNLVFLFFILCVLLAVGVGLLLYERKIKKDEKNTEGNKN